MRKIFFALSLLVGSLVASNSYAAIQLTLFAPNNSTALITDNGADDADPATGSIVVISKAVGDYTFAVSSSSSNSTGFLTIQNSSVSTITGTTAGKVGILASTDGAPVGPLPVPTQMRMQSNASVKYAAGSNRSQAAVSYGAYYDTTNALSTVTYSLGVVTANPGGTLEHSGSGSINTPVGQAGDAWDADGDSWVTLGATPVSLNLLVMADFSTGTGSGTLSHSVQLNGSVELSPIPEPTSMTVWALSGLLGLAVRRRRS